jgi:hypothetical protein
MRSIFIGAKNVAEQNRTEGDSPNTALCNPSRPTGGTKQL